MVHKIRVVSVIEFETPSSQLKSIYCNRLKYRIGISPGISEFFDEKIDYIFI